MPADFTPEEEYFDGLLLEGGPYILSQHISRILASGAHFQYVDGNVIEVIRPGKDEVIVWSSGATYSPPIEVVAESRAEEEVAPLQELAPPVDISPIITEVVVPKPEPAPEPVILSTPPVEELTPPIKEVPAPVKKVVAPPVKEVAKKPEAVVAEKAPAPVSAPVTEPPAKAGEK